MNKNKTLYLAYGSNLNLKQMKSRCPTAKVIGTATIKDYQLLFMGPRGGAVATVKPKIGSSVPVLLWELEPADEAALDRYEGFPYLYRKEFIDIAYNGKLITAMVYVMNEGRQSNIPGRYYYNVILEGYKTAGFDEEILSNAVAVSREVEMYDNGN